MSDISAVVQKAEQLCQLARGVVAEAAAQFGTIVAEQAPNMSLEDMKRRLEHAIAQLEAKRSLASIAEEMLDSYRFQKNRIEFTVPAGIVDADVEAMKALNDFRWKRFREDAVTLGALGWFKDMSKNYPDLCGGREPRQERKVTLWYDEVQRTREEQEDLFRRTDLQFGDIRDITLACALHKLAFHDADLFKWSGNASAAIARTAIRDVFVYDRDSVPAMRLLFREDKAEYKCEGFYARRPAE